MLETIFFFLYYVGVGVGVGVGVDVWAFVCVCVCALCLWRGHDSGTILLYHRCRRRTKYAVDESREERRQPG